MARTTKPGHSDAALLRGLDREALQRMLAAGEEILECYRVLEKTNGNVVGDILRGQGTFYEWDHYPSGDVYDHETHAQYYYHAHRGASGEHGHFHTFVRRKGMPAGIRPVANPGEAEWPTGDEVICHLVAISMEKRGHPTHLFTTNRWVTGENWFTAGDAIRLLDRFVIDHAWPSWPTNRWIGAMLMLFRPQIERQLLARDEAVARWRAAHPDVDALEDRELEITSMVPISVERQIEAVRRQLARL